MSETVLDTPGMSFDASEAPFGMFEANPGMVRDLGEMACVTSAETTVDDRQPTKGELGTDPTNGIDGFEAHNLN